MTRVLRRSRGKAAGPVDTLQELWSSRRSASTAVDHSLWETAEAIAKVQSRYGGATLNSRSVAAVQRLVAYKAPLERFPLIRRAAVCVCLYAGRSGELQCLLSTRAAHMRSYSGDVALPGGKMDDDDESLVHTARREAFEEIGLPLDSPYVYRLREALLMPSFRAIHFLTSLPPYLSRANNLIVTPIVVFISDPTIKPILNPSEVDSLFAHPLEGFLMDTPVEPVLHILAEDVQSDRRPYHLCYDLGLHTPGVYRMHSFETKKHRIIRGFTADICIAVARLAYGREPEYDRKATGQLPRKQHIVRALREQQDFRDSIRKVKAQRRDGKL